MPEHTIKGGGGLRLHALEAGNPDGQALLLLHGFSQCRLSWTRQFESDLADDFRLVAMDYRGHGLSEKPVDAYGDSRMWAEDVDAVMETLGLDRPVLVGHAYGGVVIGDYLRFYGDERIRGIVLDAANTKVGTKAARIFVSDEFRALVPGLFSNSVDESMRALAELMRLCHPETGLTDLYFFLGYNTIVPPYVREGLLSRILDNDDVLEKLRTPALVIHGTSDRIVFPELAERHARVIPNARLSLYEKVGHAPHWESAERFNRELREFVLSLTTDDQTAHALVPAHAHD
ncbi:MAG: alpha/beta fold hydrolase [Egibacteraceae bacterium]